MGDERNTHKKTAIIFGVEGFLGQQAYKQLTSSAFQKEFDWNVIGVSKREHPYSSFIVDITYKEQLQKFIRSHHVDYILWYAAKSIPSFSRDNEEKAYEINVESLRSICEVLDTSTKILFPSSRHVYDESNQKITEQSELNLRSVYAKHKYEAEQIVLLSSPNSIVVRNFNFIGPDPVPRTFLHDVLNQMTSKEIVVHNQNQVLDVVDIRDGIRAHLHLLTSVVRPQRIFNICSGLGVSIENVVRMLGGDDVSIVSKKQINNKPIVGDPTILMNTGFAFQFPLQKTIEWILSSSGTSTFLQ